MDENDATLIGDSRLWLPVIRKGDGPLYLAVADAIGAAIASGELRDNARLPPLRTLASALGVDYTTISRAYAEAARRGHVVGRVGQGTFVRRARPAPLSQYAAVPADLGMNIPPRFDDPKLTARMWRGVAGLEESGGLDLLLRYQAPGGIAADRASGLRWLSPRLPSVSIERVLVCPGAQGAMLGVASVLTEPGDMVFAEALTYPGFRALAARLRLRVHGIPMDDEGLDPGAFDAACRQEKPKLLYCTPTLHNPTTATMSLRRREAIVEVARRRGVPIIEDDAYGPLPTTALPPLAALAPELTYYVGGLAKTLSPALRIAYLVTPDTRGTARVSGAIRATATMASPLGAAIATRWIDDGTADAVLAAIRAETHARQAIAAAILPADAIRTDAGAFHLWLTLETPWTRGEFASRLRAAGIGIVTSDAFAVTNPPEAVRLGLGAAATRASLTEGLRIIADLLEQSPAMSSIIV
jgi:DNA-binding transcriptional MocR family regulator